MQLELPLELSEKERPLEGADEGAVPTPVVLVGPPLKFDPFIAGDVMFLVETLRVRGYRVVCYLGKSLGLVSYTWAPLEAG